MHLQAILELIPAGAAIIARRNSWNPMLFFSVEKVPGQAPQIKNAMTGDIAECSREDVTADDWEMAI